MLVWYMDGDDISAAIALEKKIKNRSRAWKLAFIEKNNPTWRDLSIDFMASTTARYNDGMDSATMRRMTGGHS